MGEREISCLLIHFPNTPNSHGWARLKSQAVASAWQEPKYWNHHLLLPEVCISAKLECEQELEFELDIPKRVSPTTFYLLLQMPSPSFLPRVHYTKCAIICKEAVVTYAFLMWKMLPDGLPELLLQPLSLVLKSVISHTCRLPASFRFFLNLTNGKDFLVVYYLFF